MSQMILQMLSVNAKRLHNNYFLQWHKLNGICRGLCSSNKHYDLIVIGGGSGGLACSKEAADLGKKVAVLDFVDASPKGSTWGLGGTCVNVGCIPKKLMHQASIVGSHIKEGGAYGWNSSPDVKSDWAILTKNVQEYVKSLNWGHRVALMDKNVDYYNARGSLLDANTIKAVDKKNKQQIYTADKIVIATGLRPRYMDETPGMKGSVISSDDLFWLAKPPGKTLVVGGSYVALESAGFLQGLGFDTTIMVRSIPLRGFDQQMASLVFSHLERYGVKVVVGQTPESVSQMNGNEWKVHWRDGSDTFNTILLAIGREPQLQNVGLENAGVKRDDRTGRILGGYNGDNERTSVDNIYAIGDVLHGKPELTPVAIKAGKLLARRLFNSSLQQMDYHMVPTTVFTPLEYSCVGYSEDQAEREIGASNIEVYHAFYKPLEFNLPKTNHEQCYLKVICERNPPQNVLGIHITGPNSGEIMQGFAVAMRCGLTLDTLQSTIGIHPTVAEELVKVHITKRSGLDPTVTGC